jgi:tetratricopeptide (TPR) repeat protein
LQERYEEAAAYFQEGSENAKTNMEKTAAFYNLGNAYMSQLKGTSNIEAQKELTQKSIDAYKKALKNSPSDLKAKYNLAYAQYLQKQLKEKKQQKQQKDETDKNASNTPNDSKGNDSPNPQTPKKRPEQQQANGNMTREEAERLLEIMDEEERKVQGKLNKKAQNSENSKNW